LIGGWNLFSVSLGIKTFILNFHWRANHSQFSLVLKDEEAMDWKERFPQLPLNKDHSSKKGHEKFGEEEFVGALFLVLFFLERRVEG
jgi:hypothetical protein